MRSLPVRHRHVLHGRADGLVAEALLNQREVNVARDQVSSQGMLERVRVALLGRQSGTLGAPQRLRAACRIFSGLPTDRNQWCASSVCKICKAEVRRRRPLRRRPQQNRIARREPVKIRQTFRLLTTSLRVLYQRTLCLLTSKFVRSNLTTAPSSFPRVNWF